MISVKELEEKLEKNNYDSSILNNEELELLNRVMLLRDHEGKIVKHFKDKFYLILGVVEHTETKDKMVVYKAMYDTYKKYVRPIDMFLSKVDKEKYPDVEQEYRFEFIEIK
jgi:hypothetical protein